MQLDRLELLDFLKSKNKSATESEIFSFLDAFFQYAESEMNLKKNSSVILSKNGMPTENPYLRVKRNAFDIMQKCKRVQNTELLWKRLEEVKSEKENE